MVSMEYANAYSEVLGILKCIAKEEYEKIPKSKIGVFEANQNKEYVFEYRSNLTFQEQNISKRAKAILALLYRDYFATDEKREQILQKQNDDREFVEEQKKSLEDVESFFEEQNLSQKIKPKEVEKEIISYKENRIKQFFFKL